jgi:hypothetical protein
MTVRTCGDNGLEQKYSYKLWKNHEYIDGGDSFKFNNNNTFILK